MKNWLKAIIIGVLLFILVRPAMAQIAESEAFMVGSEIGNHGFRQVFHTRGGGKTFITDNQFVSANPMIEGDYVTYMSQISGSWQVFLYHIPSNTKTQLTVTGNNVNPRIENGLTVWEGWVDPPEGEASWQVFLYDGTGVKQLTNGDLSVNPDIEGDNIIMARRGIAGTWRSVLYSLVDGSFADITTGIVSKHPRLVGKKIFHNDEEFPLITDDIYLLGFEAIPSVDELTPITEEDILEEILGPEATQSAQLEESTPSGDLTSPPDN